MDLMDEDPNVDHSAQAIIEGDAIVIRVPIAYLSTIVEGGWAAGGYDTHFKVMDAPVFAKELCSALNDEDEEGTTPIHRLFDKCIVAASESGAEGIDVLNECPECGRTDSHQHYF